MKLIADCGSTKTDWCLVGSDVTFEKRFSTGGMNAVMLTEEEMCAQFKAEVNPKLSGVRVSEVAFYGAGCLSDEVCDNVRKAIASNVAVSGGIEVATDLLGAARALCGRSPGIACIMGTGSNSCYYDGSEIRDNVSPLGYILGDEGSGAVLGRQLVGDILKHQLPDNICDMFFGAYGLDRMTIIDRVYRKPGGNRFLASFAPFIKANIDNPRIRSMVEDSFEAFFVRNVLQYDKSRRLPVNFVGSIAWNFANILKATAARVGCRVGKIIKSPLDGLVEYHSR